MQVTFDISKFPDLVFAAKEIIDYANGKTTSIDFKMFDSAICDLELARVVCDEVRECVTEY